MSLWGLKSKYKGQYIHNKSWHMTWDKAAELFFDTSWDVWGKEQRWSSRLGFILMASGAPPRSEIGTSKEQLITCMRCWVGLCCQSINLSVDSQGALAGLLMQPLCFWGLRVSELAGESQPIGHETCPRSQRTSPQSCELNLGLLVQIGTM